MARLREQERADAQGKAELVQHEEEDYKSLPPANAEVLLPPPPEPALEGSGIVEDLNLSPPAHHPWHVDSGNESDHLPPLIHPAHLEGGDSETEDHLPPPVHPDDESEDEAHVLPPPVHPWHLESDDEEGHTPHVDTVSSDEEVVSIAKSFSGLFSDDNSGGGGSSGSRSK
jgi:hypothetical protein